MTGAHLSRKSLHVRTRHARFKCKTTPVPGHVSVTWKFSKCDGFPFCHRATAKGAQEAAFAQTHPKGFLVPPNWNEASCVCALLLKTLRVTFNKFLPSLGGSLRLAALGPGLQGEVRKLPGGATKALLHCVEGVMGGCS